MGPGHLKNTGMKRRALRAKVGGHKPTSTAENAQSNTTCQFRFVAFRRGRVMEEPRVMGSLGMGRLWGKTGSLWLESNRRRKEQSSRRGKKKRGKGSHQTKPYRTSEK